MAHLVEHLKAPKRQSLPDERNSKIHKRQYANRRTPRATAARIRASNAAVNPFIDRGACAAYATAARQRLEKRLAEETAQK